MIILMLNVDQSKVCTRRPLKFQGNGGFVFDRTSLKGKGDGLCTDLGSFVNKGQSGRIMTVEEGTSTRSAAIRNGPISCNDNLLEACQVHRFLQNDHSNQ